MRKKLTPEERKGQIIKSALKLFRELGYEQTTVQNIIDEAGISKGGFYHHYDSKEKLLEDIGIMFIQKGLELGKQIASRDDLSGLEKINKYIREMNSIKQDRPQEVFALLSEMYSGGKNQKLEDLTFGYGQQYIAPLMKSMIEQGIQEGDFKTQFPEEAAEVFVRLFILHQREMAEALTDVLKKKDKDTLEIELRNFKRKYLFFQDTLEKILGVKEGSLVLEKVADETLEALSDVLVKGKSEVD